MKNIIREKSTIIPAAAAAALLFSLSSPAYTRGSEPVFQCHFNQGYLTAEGVSPLTAEGLNLEESIVNIPAGEPRRGVLIDGSDRLEYEFPPGVNLTEGTFELWFSPSWNSASRPLDSFMFARSKPFHGNGFSLMKDGGNNYRFFVSSPAGEAGAAYGAGSRFKAGRWYHLAATWDPDEIKLYLDGNLVAGDYTNPNRPDGRPDRLCLGHDEGGNLQAEGVIDEFKIYPYARTIEEIRRSRARGLECSELKARPLPVLRTGETRKLSALAYAAELGSWIDPGGNEEWLAADETVLAVNGPGEATGRAEGTTGVRAAFGGLTSAEITVEVAARNRTVMLIDGGVYGAVAGAVERYREDVESTLPYVLIVDHSLDFDATSPEEVREVIRGYHYQTGVEGVILAGHAPYALWEEDWTDWKTQSRGCACPLFYEDLDAEFFRDNPANPAYNRLETAGSFPGPEVWTAWLYPDTRRPEEVAGRLEFFLDKTHLYHSGESGYEETAVFMSHHDLHLSLANTHLPALAPRDGSFFPASGVEHYGLQTGDLGEPVPTRPLRYPLANPPDEPFELHRELLEGICSGRDILIYHLHCHGHPGLLWLPTETEPRDGVTAAFVDTLDRGPLLFCATACGYGKFNINPDDSIILAWPFSGTSTLASCGQVSGPAYSRFVAPVYESLARGNILGRAHYDRMMEEPVPTSFPRLPIVIGDPFIRILLSPGPSPTPTPRSSATPTPTPSATPTPTGTVTPTPSAMPTATPSATSPPPVSLNWGDFDGDGSADIAVFRPGRGLWAIRSVTRVYFGAGDDRPVAADFNGNGTTEIAVFREDGRWAVRGLTRFYFGTDGDRPLRADFDGDGKCDPGIFREDSGLWAIRGLTRVYYGRYGDRPIQRFRDPAGRWRIGVFRPSSGLWAVRGLTRCYFGGDGDQAVPAFYFRTGETEVAIYRDVTGLWAVRGISRFHFGAPGDLPVPGFYTGGGEEKPAVFRPANGLWAVRGETRVYFGREGDIPVSR